MTDDLPYPCAIVVHCDLCPTEVRADYLVRESDTKDTRLGYARTYLRTQGWRCDETGDWCPDHINVAPPITPTNQES